MPEEKLAAIEVALPGTSIRMLSNPYGIATLLGLDADETRAVTPIAKSLIGKRSAVVIRTPNGNIKENILPAGEIVFHGQQELSINIDRGADEIMDRLAGKPEKSGYRWSAQYKCRKYADAYPDKYGGCRRI